MLPISNSLRASILCVYKNYATSFCNGKCNCEDVCKNRKSGNILKLTLLLRELEILYVDDNYQYEKKLELYTPVIHTLCQCS